MFKEKKLRDTFSNSKKLIAAYGADNAKKIQMRLNELSSADNLSLIPKTPPPRLHALGHDRAGEYAVVVKEPFRLVFMPSNDPLPVDKDGAIILELVTQITIMEVVDYHGK